MSTRMLAALVLMMGALPGRGDEGRRFGDAGTLVPSGGLSFTRDSNTTSFNIAPTVQYFLLPEIALGLGLSYGHLSTSGGVTLNSYGGSVSLAYNLRATDELSILPQISFSGAHFMTSGPVILAQGSSVLALGMFVPLLFHPARHIFLGIGPELDTSGPSSNLFKDQTVGLRTVIGAWL